MMWLLTVWGGVQRTIKWAGSYPCQAALIASLCLSAWLYAGKQSAYRTIAKRDATIVAMEQSSKLATAIQIALNKQVTDKQTQIARMIDANETNRRDIANRSNAYAGRMSAKDYCRKANPAPENHFTSSSEGASADAVVVNRADFDILTSNTARLIDVKAWGDALINEGLAK